MAFKHLILLLQLIFCHCDVTVFESNTKVWQTTSERFIDFGKDDPDCTNQTFIYQKEGGIYFQMPEEINTIILPSTGSIMFQQNQQIRFNSRVSKCHSDNYNTNHFKIHLSHPTSWFDTDNWRIKQRQQNEAIPHIDRIPCECDEVEFPSNHSLWIDLDYMPKLVVKQVKINEKTDDLNAFLDTALGQTMFLYDKNFVSFTEGLCEEKKSCGCHDRELFQVYLNSICINSAVCHEPKCLNPIQPIGHCCPICGAMIQLSVHDRYCPSSLKPLNDRLQVSISSHNFAGKVDTYFGIVSSEHSAHNTVQVISVDIGEYDGLSVEYMKLMHEQWSTFYAKEGDSGALRIFHSGRPYNPNRSISLWLIIFGSLILVLSMFGTIHFYYTEDSKLRKYNPFNRVRFFASPFVFARFDNTRDDDTQSIAVGVEFNETNPSTSIYDTIASAFDNPMFKGRNKEKKIETIGPNVLNQCGDDDGESVASVKLVEVELDSAGES